MILVAEMQKMTLFMSTAEKRGVDGGKGAKTGLVASPHQSTVNDNAASFQIKRPKSDITIMIDGYCLLSFTN